MEDGKRFQETVLLPKGDPGAPLSDAELEDEFRGNCDPVLGAAQTDSTARRGAAAVRNGIGGGAVGAAGAGRGLTKLRRQDPGRGIRRLRPDPRNEAGSR